MTAPLRVLVVDDDKLGRETLLRLFKKAGYDAEGSDNAFAALELLTSRGWQVVITDLRMPTKDGITFLKEVKRAYPDVEVIVITGYGSVESAVEAMREGAVDYLTKPFKFDELEIRLRRLQRLFAIKIELRQLRGLLADTRSTAGLIIHSPPMRQVWDRIGLFAEHQAPVLVTGETGTGKEMVARALHQLGNRSEAPFVPVASGAIPRELAESELFGHERGAFTGAIRPHSGSFERARAGTLLLDDVDDLPPEIQVKLLRVLQEGTVRRVGGDREIPVEARLVTTTKIDLQKAVAAKTFREDLYYRLCGLEIRLPPLRERGDEILVLAQHFLRELASSGGREAKALSSETVEILRRHHWPGNVRELRRVMETAEALCRKQEIQPDHLPEYLQRGGTDAPKLFTLHLGKAESIPFQDLVRQFEDELIDWAMRRAGGRQKSAAEHLHLPRTTLQTKLARFEG